MTTTTFPARLRSPTPRSWRARSRPRSPPPRAAAGRPSLTPRRRHAMPENSEETITLAGDLHARPAGALAVAAAQFSSTVQLIVAGGAGAQADAKSVLA